MTRSEEQRLVANAQADPEQFSHLYQGYVNEIYRFIYYKTTNKEVTEDLTSQTFMKALEHLSQFRYSPGTRFSSWLYAIARNQVIDYYRRNKLILDINTADVISHNQRTDALIDKTLEQEHVMMIMQQLREPDREILQLRLWQDKTYTEIASILGSNVLAVRARFSRAMKKFKIRYTKEYGTNE